MTEDSERLATAREITAQACVLARRYFHDLGSLDVENKGVQDFVTQADREVEDLVRERLREAFPGEGFVGEERGREPGRGAWVLDPIDGTANFMRGIPMFGVSLAYVDEARQTRVGIIEDVAADRTYYAQRNGGAFCNGERLSVSGVAELDRSAVCVGYWTKGGPEPFLDAVRRLVEHRVDVRRFGAACIALASIASGRVEGFWQVRINSWDVAAGLLLVAEAGGHVSPFYDDGGLDQPVRFIASNRALAAPLARLLESVQP